MAPKAAPALFKQLNDALAGGEGEELIKGTKVCGCRRREEEDEEARAVGASGRVFNGRAPFRERAATQAAGALAPPSAWARGPRHWWPGPCFTLGPLLALVPCPRGAPVTGPPPPPIGPAPPLSLSLSRAPHPPPPSLPAFA